MKFSVCIESGTCGYSDCDHCDMLLQEDIQTDQLPSKGDYLILNNTDYLVMKVCRCFTNNREYNTVYVLKI